MRLTEAIDLAGMSSELDEMTIDEVTTKLRSAVRAVQAELEKAEQDAHRRGIAPAVLLGLLLAVQVMEEAEG